LGTGTFRHGCFVAGGGFSNAKPSLARNLPVGFPDNMETAEVGETNRACLARYESGRPRMSRVAKITLVTAGLWFLVFTAFVARPHPLSQLFSMLVTVGLLLSGGISLVLVFTRWRQERWRSIIPIGACALAVVLAPEVGGLIQQFLFIRSLPHYESTVRQMESGSIPVSAELRRVPQAEGASAYAVLAQRTNGVLCVEFLTGGGFPVKHSGYLYCSTGIHRERFAHGFPMAQEARSDATMVSDFRLRTPSSFPSTVIKSSGRSGNQRFLVTRAVQTLREAEAALVRAECLDCGGFSTALLRP
jgi:hypothetical protein